MRTRIFFSGGKVIVVDGEFNQIREAIEQGGTAGSLVALVRNEGSAHTIYVNPKAVAFIEPQGS